MPKRRRRVAVSDFVIGIASFLQDFVILSLPILTSGTVSDSIEPVKWLGVNLSLAFGLDSYPNPFGMVELGVSFALPLN